MAKATYYFDGSGGIGDAAGVWTNDTSATDGSTATYAHSTTNGTTGSNNLYLEQTNAPTTGDPITQVRARIYGRARGTTSYLYCYVTGSGGTGTAFRYGNTVGWGDWVTLEVPSGGWEWLYVNQLNAVCYLSGAGTNNEGRVYRVELEVTYTANEPPTSTLASPATSTVLATDTPELTFSATDPEGDAVAYQVQVSEDITFASTHTDALSGTDAGFSGAGPYASGASVTYTVQSALTRGAVTYYWRVRAKDPSGSNSWGAWTPPRTMITEAVPPTVTTGSSSDITATQTNVAGEVVSDGGATITERGFVYATTANPTTANSKKTVSGLIGSYDSNLTGLSSNTPYNYRAYATNSAGTSYGSNQTFTTVPGPSIVAVTSITDATFDTTSVNVTVEQPDDADITERGVAYATTTSPTTSDSKVVSGSGAGVFTASLTGLTGSTTYFVRAYAITSSGTTYSPQASFSTLQSPSPPTVTTGSAVLTADITSKFNGSEVVLDGSATVTERGIVFSETETIPTTADRQVVAPAGGLGTYDLSMTGLEAETTYYVRAYAVNSYGTGYGSVVSFTTAAPFIPDEGDGYWSWAPGRSQATVGRTQPTTSYSSVNLPLADLGLTDGLEYTFYFGSVDADNGEPVVKLERFDGATVVQDTVVAGTPFTFTYDETLIHWNIRLFVTQAGVEAENITAVFNDMYLAQESAFSGFVPFSTRGITEVKIVNNEILDDRRDDVISSIFDQLNGISYHPFSVDTEGLGYFEIGDRVTIIDDNADEKSVVIWNTKLTIDGGISETLRATAPDLTETEYSKAGNSRLRGNIRNTQLKVDKQAGEILALVSDMYDFDGVVNTKYTELKQDNESIIATVQGAGGVNLLQNSVMYAFDNEGLPDSWTVTGAGTLIIQASPESQAAGAVSGNQFTLDNKAVTQRVTVRKDVDFIEEENKQYYSLSARVKKNIVGVAHIKLTNRNETVTIDLPDQTGYYWDIVSLEAILPLDDHYEVEIYSDTDADLQVTDLILAPGKVRHEWTQANGEVMNQSVAITKDGMTIRSPQFKNDYTKIDALGFEVHSKEVGGDRVFGFNKDETNVSKLKADNQISMPPMRTVPINYDSYKGWAFVLSEEEL